MKIKALLLLLGITLSHLVGYAQKKEFKFGKIAPEDFAAKAPGADTAASAVKLFDVGNCYFEIGPGGFVYIFEKHVRYKVLNKNGYDLANYKIGLRGTGSSKEVLLNMDAATYNMVDGKMVASKLTKDAKFTEELTKAFTYKKFTLPNVKEGSIIEYKYTIRSPFIFNLRGWSFQSGVPTIYTEYNVKIPEFLIYKTNFSGYMQVKQTKHEDVNATYGSSSSTAKYDQYVLENVPALKNEAYLTTIDDYIPSVDFELQATRFPGEMYKDFSSTWPKIIAELKDDENIGGFVNKNSYAKSVLPGILKGEQDTLTMATLIFNYVKNNLKWNDEYSFYTSATNPKTIFEKKSGNAADINLSLLSLLNEAKIQAYAVLLSTRDNGMHPGYPIISKFNNVIVCIVVNNKNVLLDATDKDIPVGLIGYDNLNHTGFAIDIKNGVGAWIATEPTLPSEKIFNYTLALDKENKLKGKLSQYSRGYSALNLRDKYRTTNNETEFLKNYKKDKTGLELKNYKIDNLDNLDELLTESMDVEIDDNVEEAGNLVYFTPLLYERTKENLFKHEQRVFPVDFAYPFKENYRITVTFPEDYEIDKLPKSMAYKLPDNKGSFSISFVAEGKTLLVKSIIDLPKSVYEPDEYFDLKELFKAVVEKQAEQIVFKKKS
ncbi:DUF3858 domain-containing protein [Pedobacter sp. KR3-3]|uniref:DUF3858 domain-containing protein n=1 Tax=Pedobacter albus TaxID=3113905 RepID=A0ABU7I378_9SPHI|nr:DUF3858 domain-containing protein [Pedobacter sp. KR3-3]MEE1943917.1 DUF3858 domain-containing protein [Pedobacter sp. KR3-3]